MQPLALERRDYPHPLPRWGQRTFKVPQQTVAFYHQKWNGPEVLTMDPLLNVLKLSFEWVRSGGE